MFSMLTVHGDPGLLGVCGAKLVGDDALVTPLVLIADVGKTQHGRVLIHPAGVQPLKVDGVSSFQDGLNTKSNRRVH